MPFTCSICAEESTRICVRCTKDACDNHLCEKCRKCSDCCECEVALAPQIRETVRVALHVAETQEEPVVENQAVVVEAPPVQEAPTDPVAEAPPAEALAETTVDPDHTPDGAGPADL
jgi:hypothetical protein